MRRLFWKLYYHFFKEPQTASDIIIAHCRINGWPYINMKMSKMHETDFLRISTPDGQYTFNIRE